MHFTHPVAFALLLTPALGYGYLNARDAGLEARDAEAYGDALFTRNCAVFEDSLYARDASPQYFEEFLMARDADAYEDALYARDADVYEDSLFARDPEAFEYELLARKEPKALMALASKHAKVTYGTTRKQADKNANTEFKASVWSNTHKNQVEKAQGKTALNDNKWKAAQVGASLFGGAAGWAKFIVRDAYSDSPSLYSRHALAYAGADALYECDMLVARKEPKHLMALASKHAKNTYGTTRAPADKNANKEFKAGIWSHTHTNQIDKAKGKSALNDNAWKAGAIGATLVGGGAAWANTIGIRH